MRILQLIDSLNPGGAEKMAVNFANEWVNHAEKSYLIVTNKGGDLQQQLSENVDTIIFERSKVNSILLFFKVLLFIKKNRIDYIQAHTSSFKWARIIKFFFPKVHFFWHDHNGDRKNLQNINKKIISASKYFDGAISCNEDLNEWAKNNLKVNKAFFVPNFATLEIKDEQTTLKGEPNKRIVCIANWRHPKNHLLLIKSFHNSKITESGWSLHLIGNIYNDEYSETINNYIKNNGVTNVYVYGKCIDTNYILSQANVGVLVSSYEGFPVTLLEYGMMKLCPIVTNVGFMPKLIKNFETGFVIENNNSDELQAILGKLVDNNLISEYAVRFHSHIISSYSASRIVNELKQKMYA